MTDCQEHNEPDNGDERHYQGLAAGCAPHESSDAFRLTDSTLGEHYSGRLAKPVGQSSCYRPSRNNQGHSSIGRVATRACDERHLDKSAESERTLCEPIRNQDSCRQGELSHQSRARRNAALEHSMASVAIPVIYLLCGPPQIRHQSKQPLQLESLNQNGQPVFFRCRGPLTSHRTSGRRYGEFMRVFSTPDGFERHPETDNHDVGVRTPASRARQLCQSA